MNLNITPYKLLDIEMRNLESKYSLVLKSVNLNLIDKTSLTKIPSIFGVYFWVMSYKGSKYKIYIGKTNSLKRRLNDYSINFQIHSPNDFKLRFFQDFINSHFNDSTLDLYFMECSKNDYTERETDAINTFKPVINERAHVSDEMKNKMKQAFEEYYKEIFISKLST